MARQPVEIRTPLDIMVYNKDEFIIEVVRIKYLIQRGSRIYVLGRNGKSLKR